MHLNWPFALCPLRDDFNKLCDPPQSFELPFSSKYQCFPFSQKRHALRLSMQRIIMSLRVHCPEANHRTKHTGKTVTQTTMHRRRHIKVQYSRHNKMHRSCKPQWPRNRLAGTLGTSHRSKPSCHRRNLTQCSRNHLAYHHRHWPTKRQPLHESHLPNRQRQKHQFPKNTFTCKRFSTNLKRNASTLRRIR